MQIRLTTFSKSRTQRWLRIGSVLISFAAVTLLATAFGAHFYSASLSSVLLTLSLIALGIAIGLHVRFLLLARREHRETVSVLDATEQEYKSVFDSTLDGILPSLVAVRALSPKSTMVTQANLPGSLRLKKALYLTPRGT
jgi:hypothetical protein